VRLRPRAQPRCAVGRACAAAPPPERAASAYGLSASACGATAATAAAHAESSDAWRRPPAAVCAPVAAAAGGEPPTAAARRLCVDQDARRVMGVYAGRAGGPRGAWPPARRAAAVSPEALASGARQVGGETAGVRARPPPQQLPQARAAYAHCRASKHSCPSGLPWCTASKLTQRSHRPPSTAVEPTQPRPSRLSTCS